MIDVAMPALAPTPPSLCPLLAERSEWRAPSAVQGR